MKKKLLSVLLVMVFIIPTLIGCSGKGNEPTEDKKAVTNSETITDTAKGSSTGETVDPWAKYEEPVTAEFIKAVDISGDAKDYTQENPFIDLIADKLGINIKYKWVSTSSAYAQKVALMLASNDLADIMTVDMTTMKQMYDAHMIQPLTDVYDTYATEDTKQLMGYGKAISFETGTIDGELYGIPLTTPVLETMHALFLRTDWLENLGLSVPTNFQELEEVLYAFTYNDPDQNGIDDTYGIGISKDLYSPGYEIKSIANELHAYPDSWIEKDGKIVYGSVQPEMRTTLEILAKWYKDGIIDPEFTAKDFNEEGKLTAQGKIGAFYGVQWAQFQGDAFPTLFKEDPKAQWTLIGIPELSADSNPAKAIVYDNTSTFIVVRKDYEHPEVAVKILNMLHKIGAGDSSDYFSTAEEFVGVWDYWGWMPFAPESVHGNIKKWVNVFAAIDKQDSSLVEYNYNALDLYNKQMEYLINNDYRTSDDTAAKDIAAGQYSTRFSGIMFGYASDYAEKGLLEYDMRGAIITDTMTDSLATLQKLELETFSRIITGDADITEFDNFVDQWNVLGGAEIQQEMNEYYGY